MEVIRGIHFKAHGHYTGANMRSAAWAVQRRTRWREPQSKKRWPSDTGAASFAFSFLGFLKQLWSCRIEFAEMFGAGPFVTPHTCPDSAI